MATSLDQTNQCQPQCSLCEATHILAGKDLGLGGVERHPHEPSLKVHRDLKDPFARVGASPKRTAQNLPRQGRRVGPLRQPHSLPGTAFL